MEIEQHTRKPPVGAGDVDYNGSDARGASAVRDAFRAQRVLNHMSKAEAEKHDILEHDRTLYIRVDLGKANNSWPQEAVWRRLTSVTLPNDPDPDEVGVMTPWHYPGTGPNNPKKAAVEQKSADMFMTLLTERRASGQYVTETKNSPYYAPRIFAESSKAKAAKISKAHFEVAMTKLFEAGRIRMVVETGGDRHPRRVIVPVYGEGSTS